MVKIPYDGSFGGLRCDHRASGTVEFYLAGDFAWDSDWPRVASIGVTPPHPDDAHAPDDPNAGIARLWTRDYCGCCGELVGPSITPEQLAVVLVWLELHQPDWMARMLDAQCRLLASPDGQAPVATGEYLDGAHDNGNDLINAH